TLSLFRGFCYGDEEVGQVDLDVAAVGRTRFRVDVETERDIAHRDLESADEAAKHPQPPLHLVPGPGDPIEFVQEPSEVRRNERTKRLVLGCLDGDRSVAGLLSQTVYLVEQDRFPHPTKAGQHDALLRPARPDATQQDAGLFQYGVATHQLRRWGAGTRRE